MAASPQPVPGSARESALDVVALVASAGGLEALTRVLRGLPADFAPAVVLAQHLGGHGSRLVELLARRGPLPVEWARDGAALMPGRVTVAPPRSVLEILPDRTCALRRSASVTVDRPLDALLSSLADSYGSRALGVVLTGMGNDGAAGTAALRAVGATVIAQSEASADQPAMPCAAVAAGAQVVLALDEIAPVVLDLVHGGPVPRAPAEVEATEQLFAGSGEIRRLLRTTNWPATPLGPVTGWPDALKVTTRIMLGAEQPMAIWWGRELVMIYNEPYRLFMGEAKHPALGVPARDAWSESWDRIEPLLEPVLRGQGFAVDDWRVCLERDGLVEEIFATFSYSPLLDADGAPVGIYNTVRETTQKVVAERRLEVLRNLAVRVAGAGTPGEACESAAAALATDPEDVPFALAYLVEPAAQRALLACATGVAVGSPAAPRVVRLTAEGAPWPLARALDQDTPVFVRDLCSQFGGSAFGDPQPASTACVMRLDAATSDEARGVLVLGVSAHRPLDVAHLDFLDLVRSHVAAGLSQAQSRRQERERLTRLAELDRAKTEFFSNVSHEFRTPLTLMLAPLEERLRDGHGLTPELREELELVRRNAHRLLRLVGTMLDFSQIEAGRLRAHFVPVDLAERTRAIAAQFDGAAAHAGLELRLELDPLPEDVWIDPEMWEKIVSNLLANALKFTFDGTVEVSLRALPKHAELVVRDTGVGIPREELPFVFRRFHRVRGTRARTEDGAGIGLALVHELVRRHHGRVRVKSELDQGTAFTVWLPLGRRLQTTEAVAPRAPAQPRLAAAMAEEASRWNADDPRLPAAVADDVALGQTLRSYAPDARILVADDNADMRGYLGRLLGEQWEVLTARDGGEALELARTQRPDLVLADVMMPGLDGFQLLAVLREDPVLARTPVVLVTARAGEEAAVEGLLAGADDYIVKPFSARELLARVGGQLELARVRQRTAEPNAMLVRFSDTVRGLRDVHAVAETACRLAAQHVGADRAEWSVVDPEDGTLVVEATHPADAADGKTPAATLEMPVMVDGARVAALALHHATPRRWTADETALAEALGSRCWAEAERARAEAALRDSNERINRLVALMPAGAYTRDADGRLPSSTATAPSAPSDRTGPGSSISCVTPAVESSARSTSSRA